MAELTAPIVTVTLHPAIDQTVFVPGFRPGAVNRAERTERVAGGKGVNVATMLALGGVPAVATGFLGEDNARLFTDHFATHGIEDAFLRIPGETRTGIKIVDTDLRETTDVNLPGAAPLPQHCGALREQLLAMAEPGRWFVFSGSLPPGVEPAFLADLIAALRAEGACLAVDTSGEALRAAIEAGVDLAKPNHHELEELLGASFPDRTALLAAARELASAQVPQLILSLGGEGACFLSRASALHASAPPVEVISTVGAGDALLAGYLAGLVRDQPPGLSRRIEAKTEACARLASIFAWSRLESLSPTLPTGNTLAARLAAITIEPIT